MSNYLPSRPCLLSIHISLGNRKLFASQVLTVSFLVALVSAAMSFRSMLNLARPEYFGGWGAFIKAFLEETSSLVKVWSWVIWVLTLTAVYVANLRAAKSTNEVLTTLRVLGALKKDVISLTLLKLIILGTLSWLLGWSIGLASAQMIFRLTAYALKGPYAIPLLDLADLIRLLVWTLSAVFAGGIWPLLWRSKA